MNLMFVLILGAVGLIVGLMAYALRKPSSPPELTEDQGLTTDAQRPPVTYFSVIRQAMSPQDFAFLESRACGRMVRRAHIDRKRVAMLYLADVRADFHRLLRLARVIAVLSPEVPASHELERLRLSVTFAWRYGLVLAALYAGWLLMPQLSGISQMVSELAVRMDAAMNELGERAAVAAELASSLNRSRLDAA